VDRQYLSCVIFIDTYDKKKTPGVRVIVSLRLGETWRRNGPVRVRSMWFDSTRAIDGGASTHRSSSCEGVYASRVGDKGRLLDGNSGGFNIKIVMFNTVGE